MMSYFSPFDIFFSMFWFVTPLMLSIFFSRSSFLLNHNKILFSFFKKIFIGGYKDKYMKSLSMMLFCLFLMFSLTNFFSMFYMIFPMNSIFSSVMFACLTCWLMMIYFLIFNKSKLFFVEFIPSGCPILISWFLFIIEIVSNLIRPLTMSVRMVANIVSGHLIMSLISSMMLKLNLIYLVCLVMMILELSVGVIQAYIIFTLVSIYLKDYTLYDKLI